MYPTLSPAVLDVLARVVALGGEALASKLLEEVGLTKPQLMRQLKWMERQGLVILDAWSDGRTFIRATELGRATLIASSD